MIKTLQWAHEMKETELVNAAIICIYDSLVEMFRIFPSWRRRQLLLFDEFLRIFYGEQDLWPLELYQFSFQPDKFKKKVQLHVFVSELKLIGKCYGNSTYVSESLAHDRQILKEARVQKKKFVEGRSLA